MSAPRAADSAPLVRDVLLLDGSTLRLRAPSPEDREDIVAFYEGLSKESRYLRFHGFADADIAVRALAEAGGVERVALIGRHEGRIVATSQYDVLREPGVAEVAFAVADDFRRRGAATRMLEQLAAVAAERGIRRFIAEVLSSNRPMLSVFERAGFGVRRRGAFGELTVSLDVTPSEAMREAIDARDHQAAVASLRPILNPVSVAVVGAGQELGRAMLGNILDGGYRGRVMAVDPAGGAVHGLECARRLLDLEQAPELVIVAVAGRQLRDAAAHAVIKGAKALLVARAELGEDEAELLEIVRGGGLRLLGPSSLGVINTDPEIRLHAVSSATPVAAGRLAVCSHSGAVGIALLGQAAARRLGICSYASLGDRVDVSTNDLLELWEDDERAGAVMLYVESFGHPEHFTRIAQRVSRRKPILAVKGRRAAQRLRLEAQTHTAAALRGDAVVDALFRQAGVLRFRSGEDLFNAAQFFESQPLPLGRQIAIVTNSAGLTTLAADACATRGLVAGSSAAGSGDPLQLEPGAGAEEYRTAVSRALKDSAVDAVMVFYIDRGEGGDPAAVLDAVSRARTAHRKPLVASIIGADGHPAALPHANVPNFVFAEAAAGVLARAVERREWLSRPLGERPHFDDLSPEAAREQLGRRLAPGGQWLTLAEGEALLATHGIEVEPATWCQTPAEALRAAGAVGAPVAMKAARQAPETPADLDAVLLGLDGEAAVEAGWRELQRRIEVAGAVWTGATVQRLVAPGADLLVGAVSDPDLGPVMAVGLGGRQAGLSGAAFRVLPSTDVEADELIDASEGVVARVEGFRARARLNRDALRDLVLRFAALLRECPEAVEVDLNPVRLTPELGVVLEMRIRIERRRPPDRVKTW